MSEESAFDEVSVEALERRGTVLSTIHETSLEVVDVKSVKVHLDRIKDLEPYLVLVENPNDIDENNAPVLLAKLSFGFRRAGEYLAAARYSFRMAKTDRKRAEAIAALDEFVNYIKTQKESGHDVKATEAVREHYLSISPGVIASYEREAFYEACMIQLETIKQEFLMAISSVKAQAYGFRDSWSLSGASVAVSDKE